MQVKISGQQMSIGDSLTEYVDGKAKEVVQKYFDHAVSAYVHFVKQSYLYVCDIVVNEGTGRNMIIKSSANCDDVYSSFDQAIAKIEKQLRKYKSKLKNHNKVKVSEIPVTEAVNYVINPFREEEHIETDDAPLTIAEQPAKIETLTVAEAIMRMDLENHPALMFKNASNNRINIVYYRADGNISWVDSKE